MSKLLVTGGAGFIGSNFVLYWVKNHPEDTVINFDKLTYAGNLENLVTIEREPNYVFIQGDITNPEMVENAMKGVDTVVHFAAESHVDRSIKEPAAFVETNVVGTQVLLDTAVRRQISRFHHISTDEVFGALRLEDTNKFNESTSYNPHSPYAASKASSDHLVRAYHTTFGLPITITNCSNNFGPYQFPEKLIPLAITNAMEDKKVPVYGDGLYVRDWLYVGDHVKAIEKVLQQGKIGETYVVGGMTKDIPNIEIIKMILKILGKDEDLIQYVKDRPGHDRRYAVDWSKIKNELGWEPEFGFDEWLTKTVDWYKENEKWWKDIKNGEYEMYYDEHYGK
jgi:dTDP-glucose 4,6-dehydratase